MSSVSSLRKFFTHYSHFFLGSAGSLILGFISFPILTRVLTREEYGIVGLVTTTMFLAVSFAKAGLSDGIIRFYKEYSDSEERRTIFSSTIIFRGLIFSAIVFVLYISIFPLVYGYMKISGTYLVCFMIMSVYLLIRPLNIIVLNVLRITDRTIFYNIVGLVGRAASIILSLSLLLYVIGKFYGYFVGLVISEFIVSATLFYWFFKHYRVSLSQVSKALSVKLIKFGFPLLISELSYLLLTYIDRYMIVAYHGEDALGLYSVGYNLASYLSDMMMFSLGSAVIPIYVMIYDKEGRAKTEEFLAKCMKYITIVVIPVFVGYTVISEDLFVTLASQKYASAAGFSPIILLGSLFLGMNNIFDAGLYLKKQSRLILLIMVIALVINVILNMLLLPKYGVWGASIATLVACIASSALTIALGFRHIMVRVDFKTAAYYGVLSLVMYLVVSRIDIMPVWLDLIVKVAAGAFIIIPGVLLREKEIVEKLKARNPLKTTRQ